MSDSRIETTPHGVLVFGDVPLDDLEELCRMWTSRGWDLFDSGIAAAAGATLAFTSEKESVLWRAELDEEARRNASGDRELEWVNGTDTGLSSLYMLQELGSSEAARVIAQQQLCYRWDKHPSPLDPADLGRCIRLLDLFPEWRARLSDVALTRGWAALIGAWPELESLYREELVGGTGYVKKTYQRMQELWGET